MKYCSYHRSWQLQCSVRAPVLRGSGRAQGAISADISWDLGLACGRWPGVEVLSSMLRRGELDGCLLL